MRVSARARSPVGRNRSGGRPFGRHPSKERRHDTRGQDHRDPDRAARHRGARIRATQQAVEAAGGTVVVVGLETGEARSVNNDLDPGATFAVDKAIGDVSARDFDALIIPGGSVGADKLRASEAVVGFIRDVFSAGKPVAAICHAPWTLVEADVLDGRTLTSFPSLQTDIRNAGGEWVDREVVNDQGLITSRNPHDLPAFCATLVEEFAEGRHAKQAVSA